MNYLDHLAASSRNFGFLVEEAPMLAIDGASAELYVYTDPDASLVKARRFGETLAQRLAANSGEAQQAKTQMERITMLAQAGVVDPHLAEVMHRVRKDGNKAAHTHYGNILSSLNTLADCHELGVWLHRAITGEDRASTFQPPVPPLFEQAPTDDQDRANQQALIAQLAKQERRLLTLEQNLPSPAPADIETAVRALEIQFDKFESEFQRELVRLETLPALHRRRMLEEAQDSARMPEDLCTLANDVEAMLQAAGWSFDVTLLSDEQEPYASRQESTQPPNIGFLLCLGGEPAAAVRLTWGVTDERDSAKISLPDGDNVLSAHYLCSRNDLRFFSQFDLPHRWKKVSTFYSPTELTSKLRSNPTAAPASDSRGHVVTATSSGTNSIAISAGHDVLTSRLSTRFIDRRKGRA